MNGIKGPTGKPALLVDGMYGIGDNLHQRALIRELMKRYDVWLKSPMFTVYHDFVEQGLRVLVKPTRLRAQARILNQEARLFHTEQPPPGCPIIKIWYNKPDIDAHGSILEAMLSVLGYKTENPDFSLPMRPEWLEAADKLIEEWKPSKPIMILRQLVVRREWDGTKRNPLPEVFGRIYQETHPHFHAVSIADLDPAEERIEGPELPTETKIHDGSLTFGTMAALFKRADLVLSPAGFGPVLAQATGTKGITVYGGRESYRTTERAGAHLAPSLGINPDRPCDCHSNSHNCDKRTTMEPALERTREFLTIAKPKKILIFATIYTDCEDRQKLTEHWLTLHQAINPQCEFLLVDSASPMPPFREGFTPKIRPHIFDFGDNIGHLSRPQTTQGKDGWGRAFCQGLDLAVRGNYEYTAHIEGDMLFRLPVQQIAEEMERGGTKVASVPVRGTGPEPGKDVPNWVETALMIFDTQFLRESEFTKHYNWPGRKAAPTPEVVIRAMLGTYLKMMNWKVLRADKVQVTRDNIGGMNLDGITHCHNDVDCYTRFVEANLPGARPRPLATGQPKTAHRKVNLGCGTNRLPGWENYDQELDITKPLPWGDATVDTILIEHCLEHVTFHQAVRFFEEAHRVLKEGGAIRAAVPSLEKIAQATDPAYWEFTKKWGGEASRKGAMRAIIFAHGHQYAWTAAALRLIMDYAGFRGTTEEEPGQSKRTEFKGVEGHGKVIGDHFNRLETLVLEASKGDERDLGLPPPAKKNTCAIVLGGAEDFQTELDQALQLCRGFQIEPTVLYTNDQIATYPGEGIAITLHPQKIKDWLQQRRANQYPEPKQIWAHRKESSTSLVTHTTMDWAGSSGLFATKVAKEIGYDKILLCGVPMDPKAKHFVRHQTWTQADTFRRGWDRHWNDIASLTRSFSGWTAQKLGTPTAEFLVG